MATISGALVFEGVMHEIRRRLGAKAYARITMCSDGKLEYEVGTEEHERIPRGMGSSWGAALEDVKVVDDYRSRTGG